LEWIGLHNVESVSGEEKNTLEYAALEPKQLIEKKNKIRERSVKEKAGYLALTKGL
jgi:hypothetical protein